MAHKPRMQPGGPDSRISPLEKLYIVCRTPQNKFLTTSLNAVFKSKIAIHSNYFQYFAHISNCKDSTHTSTLCKDPKKMECVISLPYENNKEEYPKRIYILISFDFNCISIYVINTTAIISRQMNGHYKLCMMFSMILD